MKLCTSIVLSFAALVTSTAVANGPPAIDGPMPVRWLALDAGGWAVLKPADDSQIIYVSSSDGSDETGVIYHAGDPTIGAEPTRPVGELRPFKTISAAMSAGRDGMPDWVLLKRGDQWRDVSIKACNGRSASEPFVMGAYGETSARPLIIGRTAKVNVGGPNSGVSHSVVQSLDVYCDFIDPASLDYGVDEKTSDREKNKTNAGMQIATGKRAPMRNVLVENCRFRFCGLNTQNFGGVMENVVFRRNLVLDRYPVHGHTMGMWGAYATILVEECVFDHNGWLLQNIPENSGRPGRAIPLSHNTYCTGMRNTIFRRNTFLRAASIGNKWTANQGPGSARNIVIDDNLYVDGEIGISMGGNQPGPLRWKNMRITNNVMLDMGRSRPTGRTLGWYLDATDWDGGLIAGNLFLHQHSPDIRNVYAVNIGSVDAKGTYGAEGTHCRNVTIRDNVIHGLESSGPIVRVTGGPLLQNIEFTNNRVQLPGLAQPLLQVEELTGVTFRGNSYCSDGDPAELFLVGSRANQKPLSYAGWRERSGEENAKFGESTFPDPQRCIERYMESLGSTPTIDQFIVEVRKQSKRNWRPELTASRINEWIRQGFGAGK